jgi:LacI family transcriptional regulator
MVRPGLRRPATLKDVAQMAGVSPTTVSRFLSGAITLPDGTAQRIHGAAAALAYRPNPIARSLGRGVSDTIGLALPDLSNPFFGQLAALIEERAKSAGRLVMLASTANNLDEERRVIERLERGYFDALLLATNSTDDGRLAAAINASPGRTSCSTRTCRAHVPPACSPTTAWAGRWRGRRWSPRGTGWSPTWVGPTVS